MHISTNGIELIKEFEGCDLVAKKYVGEQYYTIGFGHYGQDVQYGQRITINDATQLLYDDMPYYEAKVNKYSQYNWTQNEFDALVSFCYNIGNIDQLTAYGKRTRNQIVDKMLEYNKCNGKVLKGLTERRKKERALFLTPTRTFYYPRYTGRLTKVDEVLRAIGVPENYLGNWKKRKPIAESVNIKNYVGNAYQNTYIIELAKQGKIPCN